MKSFFVALLFFTAHITQLISMERPPGRQTKRHGVSSSSEGHNKKGRSERALTPTSCSTSLHDAIKEGGLQVARTILESGANPNDYDHEGQTPLLRAVRMNSAPLVRLLLEFHAHPDLFERILGHLNDPENPVYATSPLLEACLNCSFDIIELLVKAGAQVNCVDGQGSTPLMGAAARPCRNAVSLLLSRGARMDVTTNNPAHDDHTPLLSALWENQRENVLCLLRHGVPLRFDREIDALKAFFNVKTWSVLNHALFDPSQLVNDFNDKERVIQDDEIENAFIIAIARGRSQAIPVLLDQARRRGFQSHLITLAREHIKLLLSFAQEPKLRGWYQKIQADLNAMAEVIVDENTIITQARTSLAVFLRGGPSTEFTYFFYEAIDFTLANQSGEQTRRTAIAQVLEAVRAHREANQNLSDENRNFLLRLEAILAQRVPVQPDGVMSDLSQAVSLLSVRTDSVEFE